LPGRGDRRSRHPRAPEASKRGEAFPFSLLPLDALEWDGWTTASLATVAVGAETAWTLEIPSGNIAARAATEAIFAIDLIS